VITPTVCSSERARPLTLAIHAARGGTHHLVIVIRPSLTAASC
jgi:hypothetical protein